MIKNAIATGSGFFLLIFSLIATPLLGQDLRERSIGRVVDEFSLVEPATGNRWNLAEQSKEADAVVLYFLSTECPVTNRYLPLLNRLKESSFGSHKVVVVGINSNQHDSSDEISNHSSEYELNFPILSDPNGELARRLGVTRTAEAFVLDRKLKTRYRGVIDDRFERGISKPKATKEYLGNALNAVLRGRHVETQITPVEACPLNLARQEKKFSPHKKVTYCEHVATIIQNRCQACHRPGGIGPFELMTFDDAESWSASIREVITNDLMPPWHADAPYRHFANDRSLTPEEYKTLLDWIDDGAIEGDRSKLPKPRVFSAGWSIGKPDLVLKMEKEVSIPAESPELGIQYKYIWAGQPFEKEMWVAAAEVQPGAPTVVHHASVYIVPDGVEIKLNKNDERPGGISDFFSPLDDLPHLISFVPGDKTFEFPTNMGIRIPQGARLMFEMHYTATGKKETDQTSVALKFAGNRPEHEVFGSGFLNFTFSIPPGAESHQVTARTRKFKRDLVLLTMNPHMHYRGKSFKYELVEPSGNRTEILNVPNYRFDWQTTYRLSEPIKIPKGAYIKGTATFDNSKNNPFNPDPSKTVTWGEQSWEEMMLGSFEFYYKNQ